jgi:hypothetical protein
MEPSPELSFLSQMTMMPWAAALPLFSVPQVVFGQVWDFFEVQVASDSQ